METKSKLLSEILYPSTAQDALYQYWMDLGSFNYAHGIELEFLTACAMALLRYDTFKSFEQFACNSFKNKQVAWELLRDVKELVRIKE